MKTQNILLIGFLLILLQACSGMKVVHPDRPNEQGTLIYDQQTGKLVSSYTCTMVGSNGKRVFATGKSEDEARKEAISKCQDQTVISFCKSAKISCQKN